MSEPMDTRTFACLSNSINVLDELASYTAPALALNHENPESEYLVSETANYAVVEKVDGRYRQIVRATDPRR